MRAMEMKQVSAGKLRAIGYDAGSRTLRVEFDDRRVLEYANVPSEAWRRLSSSAAMWSYFRDNIEDEYATRRVR
ncbi:MAG: hypothetical protein EFKGCFLK_01538 [Rhodocyclaceae bacterium]|nr:hypothetical protein [Rhodocyclaceae bacterium]MCK6384336.1 KTSC domain-containing protein [Rhodocyclaceae bacterium]CAG0929035.1 hypothetical protein RHDC3_00927 [Rhodocyclaceae bacterium]